MVVHSTRRHRRPEDESELLRDWRSGIASLEAIAGVVLLGLGACSALAVLWSPGGAIPQVLFGQALIFVLSGLGALGAGLFFERFGWLSQVFVPSGYGFAVFVLHLW